MTPVTNRIAISGAGPAGLAAAITAARAGVGATVYEKRIDVGGRFHGDFQGLENWTTDGDVLDELDALGIAPTFAYRPFYEVVLFGPDGREHVCSDTRPIFYLVERGRVESSVDVGLRAQALSLDIDLQLGTACESLPGGGIVAHGPGHADVIADGYLFATDAADGAFCALSSRLAGVGYAYLLVHRGRGVLATCLFGDFRDRHRRLGETTEFFRSALGLRMRHVQRFGGVGCYAVPDTARNGNILYAGEAAGFQDALAGFGMRYALISGHLAARALLAGAPESYDRLWRARFGDGLRASVVNRYLYARLGDAMRRELLRRVSGKGGARRRIRRQYAMTAFKKALYPVARRSVVHWTPVTCEDPGCTCTRCRCGPAAPHSDLEACGRRLPQPQGS